MPSRKHRSRFLIMFLLLSVALVLGACRRGGDDGDDDSPTIARLPSITPGGTSTQAQTSPTPFPSLGPAGPTPTRFAGFPPGGGVATIPASLPNNIQITSPGFGQQLQGFVTVFGSASHPDFIQYAVEFGPDPNPGGLFYPITPQAVTVPVFNSALSAWNTTTVPDGQYQIRLHVYLRGGREVTNVIVGGLQVRNRLPTNTPPRTNTNPVISPIAPLTLRPGISATVALGIYDPDNEATTFIATTDNINVAAVSPVGQAITIQARTAGIATITVRVTDSRGGSSQTSFLVTVQQSQTTNNPPNIAPIPNQILTQGTVITVPIALSDPDGDAVTFTSASALPNVVSVANGAGQSLILTASNPGTSSITVTASDGRGGSYVSVFSVVVNPRVTTNNPPVIAAIASQSLNVGENRDITLNIGDPDPSDATTLTSTVTSNNASVTATKLSNTSIRISGASAGSAQVTVTVSDGRGGSSSTVFGVTVTAPPPQNRPPIIAAIPAQTVKIGESVDITLSISDPDGDPTTFSVNSDAPGTASAGPGDSNRARVTGVAEGKANVTISVGDGRGGSTTTTFAVQVDPATVQNNAPTISQISDISLNAGDNRTFDFTYSDPDGDALNVNVASDNAGVATAIQAGESSLSVTGVAGGTANVTVSVDDGRGGTASESFAVTVAAANQSPAFSPVSPQNCLPGETLSVDLTVTDPEGSTVSITSVSDNAAASVNANGEPLSINCVAQGTANITVTGNDGSGGIGTTSFTVTVGSPPNQNPTLNDIADETCTIGDALTVTLSYTDPEDVDSISVSSSSDNAGVATVNSSGEPLSVTCVGAGTATITVAIDDGSGGTDSTTFAVTVNAPANQAPTLNDIGGQSCTVGDTLPISLSYSDPEGNAISVSSSSDNAGVASVNAAGEPLSVTCVSAGSATISVTIDDGNGGTDSTTFAVTVNAPANQAPTLNDIGGQACTVGDTLPVSLSYSDPEGNAISVTSSSDNAGVASVNPSGEPLSISCATEGTATISVTIDDGNGGTDSTSFSVSVAGVPNQDPTLDPIAGQTCNVGDTLNVTITYNDPEGNAISVASSSDNPGVASVNAAGEPLSVTCSSDGTANISVTIDDGNGGSASTSFSVSVASVGPPPFDVSTYPEIPDIGALQGIDQVYANGQTLGNRPNVFAVAGDESVNSTNFLDAIAAGTYDLGSNGSLQGTLDFYNSQPAHDSLGDTAVSYNVQSAATGDGWRIDYLFDPAYANGAICGGQAPLACELALSRPVAIFISFTPTNATLTPADQFNNLLQQAVSAAIANGTIPVLVTLPNDGSVGGDTLAQYNEIIVTVAESNDVPLWNLYNTMQGASGVNSVGGTGPTDFTDGGLTGGVNRRNLAALEVLDAIRQELFP